MRVLEVVINILYWIKKHAPETSNSQIINYMKPSLFLQSSECALLTMRIILSLQHLLVLPMSILSHDPKTSPEVSSSCNKWGCEKLETRSYKKRHKRGKEGHSLHLLVDCIPPSLCWSLTGWVDMTGKRWRDQI